MKLPGGLRITAPHPGAAARGVVLAVLGVTLFVVVLDGWLLRRHLSADYLAFYTGPLVPRMLAMSLLACIEELKFRLLLMTALVALASLVRRKPPACWFVAIIVAAQFANVWALVLADPLYASLRYWAVGCVWGWLYWRHGWLAALVGHGAVHLMLDPALLLALG